MKFPWNQTHELSGEKQQALEENVDARALKREAERVRHLLETDMRKNGYAEMIRKALEAPR